MTVLDNIEQEAASQIELTVRSKWPDEEVKLTPDEQVKMTRPIPETTTEITTEECK